VIGEGVVVWFTGKPSSGKSTLARRVRDALAARGDAALLLDGDEVRAALRPKPGYDPDSRDAFYATLGNIAALLARQGAVVLVAATAHARAFRARARAAAPRFVEVSVEVSDEELARRDAKGLYRAVREGSAHGVPGADLPYEAPESPEVRAAGGKDDAAVARVLAAIEASQGTPCT
jgi:adenylylsulfate kinase